MEAQREIPIFTDFPREILNTQVRRDMTRLVFSDLRPLPKHIDTIMTLSVPTGYEAQASKLRKIFAKADEVRQLIITGGMPWRKYPKDEPNLGLPQSAVLLRAFGADNLPPNTRVNLEGASNNTKENVVYGWNAMLQTPETGSAMVVVAKNFHTGRGVGTVRAEANKRGWQGEIYGAPYGCTVENEGQKAVMGRTTWHKHDLTTQRVGGELKRLWTYGDPKRGDVYVSPEDRKIIAGIMQLAHEHKESRANGRTVTVPSAELKK